MNEPTPKPEYREHNQFHNHDQIKRSITRELEDVAHTLRDAQAKVAENDLLGKLQELATIKKKADALLDTTGIPNDALQELKAFGNQADAVVGELEELNRAAKRLIKAQENK